MYFPGTRFEVKFKIDLPGGEMIDPGTKGTILGNIKKMVGKAYEVKLEDGRKFFIHSAIINNQTEVIEVIKD